MEWSRYSNLKEMVKEEMSFQLERERENKRNVWQFQKLAVTMLATQEVLARSWEEVPQLELGNWWIWSIEIQHLPLGAFQQSSCGDIITAQDNRLREPQDPYYSLPKSITLCNWHSALPGHSPKPTHLLSSSPSPGSHQVYFVAWTELYIGWRHLWHVGHQTPIASQQQR